MRPFQIYRIKVRWGDCDDPRPWVIVQTRPHDIFGCFPISSQCYGECCFALGPSHADFPATGLTRPCNILYATILDLRREQFVLDGKLQLKGELQGQLLRDFRAAAGV
jgi:hypothetical protein